jgi:phosphoribosylaminoimidazolecarboxamide formyltransferase/IMP cyclohydrolase
MHSPRIQRALISVSDKLGLASFAHGLAAAGVEIYSTGGTASHLREEGLTVHDIAQYTGFPELMDGRLKTLHPKVFGGILCRHDRADDMHALRQHAMASFELVVVNLYPFEATVARDGVTLEQVIEKIDIGGPSLVRAAAKNYRFVTIATDAAQYAEILESINATGSTTLELRQRLAAVAFARTAGYDRAISRYFADQGRSEDEPFPEHLVLGLERVITLRYGENPHQRAALYRREDADCQDLIAARQLSGKELSYNNILDLDAALTIARSLPDAAAVVVKHNNPCGAASANTLAAAAERALDGDPLSAFGSILGFNRTVDVATAEVLAGPGLFIEAIVAPLFEPAAVEILTTRPKWRHNVRLLEVGELRPLVPAWHYRPIAGGMLLQDDDLAEDPSGEWQVVTTAQPDESLWDELRFSWAMVRHVKSNAIVVTRDRSLYGVGAGQMSRVDSVEIALHKASSRARGAVLASDAFFPFPDSIDRAAAAGIAAIIQPGGSKRDDDVIACCNQHAMPMVFTLRRHFRH